MFKKNILVTGIGGDIGQSVIKCFKAMGYINYLIGCDADYYAGGKAEVQKFFLAPLACEIKEYLAFLKKIVKEENIQYIMPTTEGEIEFLDLHRDLFPKNKVELFINSPYIIRTFSDKYKTVNFLKKNGILYPETYLIEDYNNCLSLPVLIKPRRSSGSKGIRIIQEENEFNYYRKDLKNVVVQEIVGNIDEEYTVGVFSTGKKVYSIAFKRYLGYEGLSKFVQLVVDKKIEQLAEKIAKILNLKGSINIQLRKTKIGYIPFEINPRLSSTVYLRHYFGFKDIKWWIDLKEGRPISYRPLYKKGVAVRTIGEVFFDLKPL